ncbi:jg16, partial [Pararge aegeria aegeria]
IKPDPFVSLPNDIALYCESHLAVTNEQNTLTDPLIAKVKETLAPYSEDAISKKLIRTAHIIES